MKGWSDGWIVTNTVQEVSSPLVTCMIFSFNQVLLESSLSYFRIICQDCLPPMESKWRWSEVKERLYIRQSRWSCRHLPSFPSSFLPWQPCSSNRFYQQWSRKVNMWKGRLHYVSDKLRYLQTFLSIFWSFKDGLHLPTAYFDLWYMPLWDKACGQARNAKAKSQKLRSLQCKMHETSLLDRSAKCGQRGSFQ